MSIKKTRQYGLFISICMVVGTIVGIGIFFKNNDVFKESGNNSITILIAWIFSGIIALSTAISFSEVGSTVRSSKSGLSFYAEKLFNKKLANYIKALTPQLYLGIIGFVLSLYTTFFGMDMLGYKNVHFGYMIIIGTGIFLFFLIMSTLSRKSVGNFQIITTIIKFLPLIIVIIIGIVGPKGSHNNSLLKSSNVQGFFSFKVVISLLPTILFAFDGFTIVSEMGKDIKNPQKNIPLSITIGMSLIFGIYLAITLSQLSLGEGNVLKVLELISSNKTIQTLGKILLVISALGVCNSMIAAQTRSMERAIEEELVIFASFFKRFKKIENGSFLYCLFLYLFYVIIIGIPSITNNTLDYLGWFSDTAVIFNFTIYAILIFGQISNRRTNKTSYVKMNSILFYTSAIIAILGITITISYQFFIIGFYDPLVEKVNYTKAVIFLSTLCLYLFVPNFVHFKKIFKRNKNYSNKQ